MHKRAGHQRAGHQRQQPNPSGVGLLGLVLAAIASGCVGSVGAVAQQPAESERVTVLGSAQERDRQIERLILDYLPNARPEPQHLPAYFYRQVDLNGDGRTEIIAHTIGPGLCGKEGCITLVIGQKLGSRIYQVITDIPMSHGPIIIEPQRSKGWNNLIVFSHNAVARRLRFDGAGYGDPWEVVRSKSVIPGLYLFGRQYRSYRTQPIVIQP